MVSRELSIFVLAPGMYFNGFLSDRCRWFFLPEIYNGPMNLAQLMVDNGTL
jgi:hypothetical protein